VTEDIVNFCKEVKAMQVKIFTLVARGNVHNNYGAVLQAYALQRYIANMGIDSEYIDYNGVPQSRRKKMKDLFRKFWRKKLVDKLWVGMSYITKIGSKLDTHRARTFERFKTEYIKFSERSYRSELEIREHESDITKDSILLVGSDQVWNCNLPVMTLEALKVYLLTFTKEAPKISYASSVATPIRKELRDLYKEALSDFCAISVREVSSANYLEEATGIRPEVVLDPTCLLPVSAWEELVYGVKTDISSTTSYIFSYELLRSHEILDVIWMWSKKQKVYLVHYIPTLRSFISKRKSFCYYTSGPKEFVRLIHDASFVITSSFHGTVFAVIFKKPFYAVLPSTGHMNVSNERIIDFLKMLNLESRIIADPRQILSMPLDDCINWEEVHQILERERQRSAKFLRNAIDSALKAKGMNDR